MEVGEQYLPRRVFWGLLPEALLEERFRGLFREGCNGEVKQSLGNGLDAVFVDSPL